MIWFAAACCIVASLWRFVFAPIKVYRTQRTQTRPIVEMIEPADVPPEVARYFASVVSPLEAEGFRVMASLGRPNATTNVRAYAVLMLNPAGDKATILVTAITTEQSPRVASKTIIFGTRFETGENYSTGNIKTPGIFRYDAKDINTKLPSIEEPCLMYRVHCWVMNRQHPHSAKIIFKQSEAVNYYVGTIIESYEQQVRFGRFVKDSSGEFYRPTWKGAFLMTWPLLHPLKEFYLWQMKRREQAVLQAFEAADRL